MWSKKPTHHFEVRKEENRLFDGLREINLTSITGPRRSCANLQFGAVGLETSASSSVAQNGIHLKPWYKVSKEVRISPSFKAVFANGKPQIEQPAIEVVHQPTRSQGSSIAISYTNIAVTHMQRLYSVRNIWVSGLINFGFKNERLFPQQLSLTSRYHPSGANQFDNTIVYASFDCAKVDKNYNPLTHGKITLSVINRVEDNVDVGILVSQATGIGNDYTTAKIELKAPPIDPDVQLGVAWRHPRYEAAVRANIHLKPAEIQKDYEARLMVQKKLSSVSSAIYGYVGYAERTRKPTWGIGLTTDLEGLGVIPSNKR